LIDELQAEPLWHASMGSKELFHSNMLAWMVHQFPESARQVFQPWLVPADRSSKNRVQREHRHLDLIVEFAGSEALVIENKTFSMPDTAQLEQYSNENARKLPGTPTLLLLSLVDPGWPAGAFDCGEQTWRWVSYRELAERIRSVFGHETGFAADVLSHEARLLELLTEVLAATSIRGADEPLWLSSELLKRLDEANVADAVRKARSHEVGALLRERIRADRTPEPAWPLEVGFSNGTPLLAAFWDAEKSEHGDDRHGPELLVGWQQQGRQWRLAMVLRKNELWGRGHHDARADFARHHLDYFDFQLIHEAIGVDEQECLPRSRIAAKEFNKYEPDFVYRYRNLPTEVTVGQFVDLAATYSRRAAEWIFGP
jgi:hypothetical protein